MQKSILYLFMSAVIALTGCGTGDDPYREIEKDEKQLSVNDVEENADRQYLYIRTVGKAPRYAASIRSFFQGDPKLVTLSKGENGIQVRQIDRDTIGLDHDSRYDDEYNEAPVLTIGGEYIDFKCTEDRWDDCTNVEQVNNDADLDWSDKNYFVPDFSQIKIAELSVNDLFMFGDCVTEIGQPRLVQTWEGYEIDIPKGVINFELEHTYQASSSCLNEFYHGDLDNLSFTTTEFISIVALDQLVSEDYKAIPYGDNDEGTYGFFTSTHSPRDGTDSDDVDGYTRTYLNRFSPEKSELTYYLSNNFYEEANKFFYDAAVESITALNIQNKLYKTGLPEVKLAQANEKHHGDLRYNFITLFDEPLDNGLAGYGPSAANPLTGEIVSGRVNQYSSNLRQGSVRYYRQVRLDYNRGKLDANTATKLTGVEYPGYVAEIATEDEVKSLDENVAEFTKPAENLAFVAIQMPLNPVNDEFETFVDFDKETKDFWSEHNMLHIDTVFAAGGSNRELPNGIKGHEIDWTQTDFWVDGVVGGQLIAFEKMPVSLQNELTIQLAAQAFAGTLTHELGHNFGLRHNFAGSRDHDNLFTEAEVSKQDAAFAAAGYPSLTANSEFTSQMDYNVNRFATTYGPYDLAALRFAYAREVEGISNLKAEQADANVATEEVKTPAFISLKEEDEKRREELKDGIVTGSTQYGALYYIAQINDLRSYSFCTDGHVSLNSNCNRSDAGETLADINQFYIDKYKDSYETQNLRHNRQAFYEDHILNYVVSNYSLFNDIRQFVEDVSSLENMFGLPDNYFVELCTAGNTAWYCENQNAVNNSANFFLKLVGEGDAVVNTTFKMIEDGSVALQASYNLAELLADYRFQDDLENKFQPGEIISQLSTSQEVTDTLKELILKTKISSEYQDLLTVEFDFEGRLLNGIKAPNASPNHPYVNERDVLGVWPDKLLAVRALVSRTTPRSSTTRGHKALVDLPEVKIIFEDMLCQMVTGNNAGCNDSGKLDEYLTSSAEFVDLSIEALPSYDHTISRYFGFDTVNGSPKGNSNLLEMVLRQIVLASNDSDYEGEQKARLWREFVGIHYSAPSLAAQAEIIVNGRIYVATEENVLALKLINQIGDFEQHAIDYADNEQVMEMVTEQLARDRKVLTYLPLLD